MVAQADLLDPAVVADPYPLYHRLRAEAPVHWNDSLEGWALLRHADVVAALRDPRPSADRITPYVAGLPPDEREALAPLVHALAGWMIVHDPPSHTRLRALVSHAFTPRAVERLRGGSARLLPSCSIASRRVGGWTSCRTSPVRCPPS
jgi:cytochrome P450